MSGDFATEYEASQYKIWLVASGRQRPEHLSSVLRYRSHCYGLIHITVEVFDKCPSGCTAFYPIYEAIKRFEHRYPNYAEQYTICGIGRKGTPSGHKKYMKLATIHYQGLTGSLVISHINRKVRPIVALMKTAPYVCKGVEFEADKVTPEEAIKNARMRIKARHVLSRN